MLNSLEEPTAVGEGGVPIANSSENICKPALRIATHSPIPPKPTNHLPPPPSPQTLRSVGQTPLKKKPAAFQTAASSRGPHPVPGRNDETPQQQKNSAARLRSAPAAAKRDASAGNRTRGSSSRGVEIWEGSCGGGSSVMNCNGWQR